MSNAAEVVGNERAEPGRMKALRAHRRGGPEELVFEDAPRPSPGRGDVLVRVGAAAITFDELSWPEPWERRSVHATPVIPSHEFAGTVAEVGPDVNALRVGMRVFGLVPFERDGAAAEFVVVPEGCCCPLPLGVPDCIAAAAALPALTAWEVIRDRLGLVEGQRLLVHGGTGSVGAFLIQFAHREGVPVTATVRRESAVARARALGASEVLMTSEAGPDVLGSFDCAVDAVGARTPEWLYRAVRRDGTLITLQEPPDPRRAARHGIQARFFVVSLDQSRLRELAMLLDEAEVEVAIAASFPLSEGRAAYQGAGREGRDGKTVLFVYPEQPTQGA